MCSIPGERYTSILKLVPHHGRGNFNQELLDGTDYAIVLFKTCLGRMQWRRMSSGWAYGGALCGCGNVTAGRSSCARQGMDKCTSLRHASVRSTMCSRVTRSANVLERRQACERACVTISCSDAVARVSILFRTTEHRAYLLMILSQMHPPAPPRHPRRSPSPPPTHTGLTVVHVGVRVRLSMSVNVSGELTW